MMMPRALRAIAAVVAVAGAIDPEIGISRPEPVRVDFQLSSSPSAVAVRDRIIRSLEGDISADTGETPDAIVMVGEPRETRRKPGEAPVSLVSLVSPSSRNVRLIAASPPDAVLVGQEAVFTAEFEAVGMATESSTIELDQDGILLAAIEHRWTSARERFTAALRYAPPSAGIVKVTVAARPKTDEASAEDNRADLPLRVLARTLHIAVYEPRPSWAAGFVRRALESDPLFATASLARPSRGLVVTAGGRLPAISASVLAAYDAVVVGAPEELTAPEVTALAAFCEERGGAAVFLPDRRPSGPYAELVSATGFDEALLDKPVSLVGDGAIGLSASELALPRAIGLGGVAVASTPQQPGRAVIVSLPRGKGRLLFSGALDAWRFRARGEDDTFARFWTGIVANLASSSKPRLSVSVTPAVAAPGDRLTLHVAFDRLAFPTAAGGEAPLAGASLVAGDGTEHFVRLWPSAEAAGFEAEIVAPSAGLYAARVRIAGSVAETAILIANGVQRPPDHDDDGLRMIAATTGGVVVDATDTGGLERHVRGLARRKQERTLYLMRSAWWIVPFAAVLCGEWALRRRRGAR